MSASWQVRRTSKDAAGNDVVHESHVVYANDAATAKGIASEQSQDGTRPAQFDSVEAIPGIIPTDQDYYDLREAALQLPEYQPGGALHPDTVIDPHGDDYMGAPRAT